MPGSDNHYLTFSEVFGKPTTEKHRPSATKKRPKKSVPIPTSVQHAKNTNLMVQCKECSMWQLVYSARKLSVRNRRMLQSKLDEYAFSCGAELTDLELGEEFPEVYVHQLMCYDPTECLYFSIGYPPICVYCGCW